MGGSWLWSRELAISWLDLTKIMVRSFCECNTVVVCIMYSTYVVGLMCSLNRPCTKSCIANLTEFQSKRTLSNPNPNG